MQIIKQKLDEPKNKPMSSHFYYPSRLFLILFLCIGSQLHSQTVKHTFEEKLSLYKSNSDSTVYRALHSIFTSNEDISYLGHHADFSSLKQRFPLEEGAGRTGYLFEGSVHQRFTVFKGRDGSRHGTKAQKIAFYFGYDIRMTNDSSHPLLPSNQLIGIEWTKNLWNSFTSKRTVNKSGKISDKRNWYTLGGPTLHTLYMTIMANHYSNGQPPGFFTNSTTKEHDYINGDFSTNNLRLMLIGSRFTQRENNKHIIRRHLVTAGLGYQYDAGTNNSVFAYSQEQDNSYGRHRLKGLFQWRISPIKFWTYNKARKSEADPSKEYRIKELFEIKVRWQPVYILGNLNQYYEDELGGEHRFASRTTFQLLPMRHRTMSLILQHYYGRDYFNIRYDNIVSTFLIGLTFNFDKSLPLKFNPLKEAAEEKVSVVATSN